MLYNHPHLQPLQPERSKTLQIIIETENHFPPTLRIKLRCLCYSAAITLYTSSKRLFKVQITMLNYPTVWGNISFPSCRSAEHFRCTINCRQELKMQIEGAKSSNIEGPTFGCCQQPATYSLQCRLFIKHSTLGLWLMEGAEVICKGTMNSNDLT